MLHSQYYALNMRGWNSRMPDVFAIYPPASKHLSALISASIESDFCSDFQGNIKIDNASLTLFSAELKDATKDLRSLSSCYSPILTRMFTDLVLKLSPEHEHKFLLEMLGSELVLMLESDTSIKTTHTIKTKAIKNKPVQTINLLALPTDDAEKEKYALYSGYWYSFYHHLFLKLPLELYRMDDAKFGESYEDERHDFSLAKELSLLALNLVVKYVGMTIFSGEIDRIYKKERAMASITSIVKYIAALKITHSNKEIYFIINNALGKINSNFGQFFGKCGIFEFIDRALLDIPQVMDVDGIKKQEIIMSHEKIVDDIYDIIISSDNVGQGINTTIDQFAQLLFFQNFKNGFMQEFLKSKKLTITFDNFGNINNITAAQNS